MRVDITKVEESGNEMIHHSFFLAKTGSSSTVVPVRASLSTDPFPLPRHFSHVVGTVIQCLALRAIHLPPASQRHKSPGETRWSIKKFHIW